MSPSTMRAWRTHEYGPPETALQLDEVPLPEPGPGEVRVKVAAVPLNLNDLERVTGGNMTVRIDLPYSPGMETMGVVDACGPGAEDMLGHRVAATTQMAHGGFAEYVNCPAHSAFEIPDDHRAARRRLPLLPVPPGLARPLRPGRGCEPARRS